MNWPDFKEADIIINNTKLTLAQSLVIRVAIENFTSTLINNGLGNDKLGKEICRNYLARLEEIRVILHEKGAIV